ncbi:MAG TPA: acyl carrier protein [Methylovorus sp.]|jgi:acyl carrier protein|nr:acyl carrier protein [Methylovorus sp.]
MSTIETFIEKFNEAVDFQEPVDVSADTRLETLPEWDSLAALGVIVMCDMEYKKTITGNDLANCQTITDIYKLVA